MKVGLKEISELSGFSVATVSNVLNNKKGVNSGTAEKVLAIARELGYLKEAKVDKVRFVIYKKHGSIVGETQFFRDLMEGVESECRTRLLPLEIVNLSPSDVDFQSMRTRIIQDSTSATLILATEMTPDDLLPFSESVGPISLLDRTAPDMKYNSTSINNADSLAYAVGEMVNRGYKDFGYLKSAVPIFNFVEREYGFRRGLVEHQLVVDEAKFVSLRPNSDGAYQDMCRYLESGHAVLPKVYLADNDIIALGALKALKEHGISVPKDVAVVGFDDTDFNEISTPTLSTIRVFKKEMGVQGVRVMLDNCDLNQLAKVKVFVSTVFVPRESV